MTESASYDTISANRCQPELTQTASHKIEAITGSFVYPHALVSVRVAVAGIYTRVVARCDTGSGEGSHQEKCH